MAFFICNFNKNSGTAIDGLFPETLSSKDYHYQNKSDKEIDKMDMNKFLSLKAIEQQRVNFEMTYVDIANGDLIAGLLLSQIIYWFLPDRNGRTKTRVTYKGRDALAKNRGDWYEEVRITPRQYDKGIKILQDLGIVEIENSMFNGKRTPFIMLNENIFLSLYEGELSRYYDFVTPISREGNTDIDKSVRPLTETTTETTTKTTDYKVYKGDVSTSRDFDNYSFDILDKQIERFMDANYEYGYIGNLTTDDIKQFFKMYYSYGSEIRGINPTKLKNDQLENIITSIACIGEADYEPTIQDYILIIMDYFNQDFPNCDYGINHFISGDVLLMRYYNLKDFLEI